jgi:hypothetical protein
MSGDYQNTKEDQHDKTAEQESIARQEAIDFHTDNWIAAVTKSPQKSHGTFDDVTEYHWSGFSHTEKTRPATSVDVFVDQLDNGDFMQQVAQILIDLHQKGSRGDVDRLFDDMAADYAEYQYEKNIKE